MPSPFPGMNPYLEHPDRWQTVHNRLIVALADYLTPLLLPKYQVDIDKRVYQVVGLNTLLVGRPDVTVPMTLPMPEEVREAYLEVKDAATRQVVTAIEILSPANKHGEGRQKYEEKRQKVLQSQTHLVEIDLLVRGKPLPILTGAVASDYRILVSRSPDRPIADLYPFNLPEPIPPFPLPLQDKTEEPTVDLQSLLHQVYDRSGYDYFIDYTEDVVLPFSKTTLLWIEEYLHQKGLRT
ncbi:MAG: DUF4058 family protein [Coleofasciculaceae cyanobacterium SM2_3_26]|nr:DUF4058 family protein [Coleofasciculaceae cyanobacterium SM2_3_26]